MTSPALLVLSLALVCSIFGTASEQTADYHNNHPAQAIQQNKPVIYDEIDNIDINMEIARTKLNKHKDKLSFKGNNNFVATDKHNINREGIYTKYQSHRDMYLNKYRAEYNSGSKMRQYRDIINAKRRAKRELDLAEKCEGFKVQDNQLTHPHNVNSFEKHYYNSTDCTTVIEAKEGLVIKLTFVDIFHIEEGIDGTCPYDYLEIRDGPQGYSKFLRKLCGSTFPSEIMSSGPYLWLKFHSDDTIDYEGFRINIGFEAGVPGNIIPKECNQTVKEKMGFIDSTEIDPVCATWSKDRELEVVWTIITPPDTKIYLNFTKYSLAKPNNCEENVLEVYGYILEFDSNLAHYCGSVANPVTSKGDTQGQRGNIMYIRLYASISAKASAFRARYTAFRTLDVTKNEKCKENEEIDCQDNTCVVDSSLKCDNYADCRLKTDEENDDCKEEAQSMIKETHIVVILVIFSLILSGMSFVFLFKCIRKLYQDHKIIKEHIRQSTEDHLDALSQLDSRFTLDAKKLQRDSEQEQENHTNEMFKQQRKLSQQHKPSSIDSDFIQETQIDLDEEPWRREVDSIPIQAQDIRIERNGRTRRDSSRREDSLRKKRESAERKERKEIRDVSVGAPDTKESGCQTRESLFQTEPAPSSDGSGSNGRGFSTFGYSGATIARPSPPAPSNTSQVTIELLRQVPRQDSVKSQKKIPDRRPMSTETTRSAPDVIIVSKPIR